MEQRPLVKHTGICLRLQSTAEVDVQGGAGYTEEKSLGAAGSESYHSDVGPVTVDGGCVYIYIYIYSDADFILCACRIAKFN